MSDPRPNHGIDRLDIRDELIDATHETAAFLHAFLWPGSGHDTEPDDGSDCHECYHQAERLLSVIADAIEVQP
jgi:hypothetical protein